MQAAQPHRYSAGLQQEREDGLVVVKCVVELIAHLDE
jgi:hypothetical protein